MSLITIFIISINILKRIDIERYDRHIFERSRNIDRQTSDLDCFSDKDIVAIESNSWQDNIKLITRLFAYLSQVIMKLVVRWERLLAMFATMWQRYVDEEQRRYIDDEVHYRLIVFLIRSIIIRILIIQLVFYLIMINRLFFLIFIRFDQFLWSSSLSFDCFLYIM